MADDKSSSGVVDVVRRIGEAYLLNTMIAEYASPEMAEHLRILATWKGLAKEEKDRYRGLLKGIAVLHAQRESGVEGWTKDALKFDEARRTVKFWFIRVIRLAQGGYVSDTFLRTLLDLSGIDLFLSVVEEMEELVHVTRTQEPPPSVYEAMRELVERLRVNA